jgi:hypothetical protein
MVCVHCRRVASCCARSSSRSARRRAAPPAHPHQTGVRPILCTRPIWRSTPRLSHRPARARPRRWRHRHTRRSTDRSMTQTGNTRTRRTMAHLRRTRCRCRCRCSASSAAAPDQQATAARGTYEAGKWHVARERQMARKWLVARRWHVARRRSHGLQGRPRASTSDVLAVLAALGACLQQREGDEFNGKEEQWVGDVGEDRARERLLQHREQHDRDARRVAKRACGDGAQAEVARRLHELQHEGADEQAEQQVHGGQQQ